jgi:hypothetical protein
LAEAQTINKTGNVRHQAVKSLYYKAVIQLSGTLAYNKWTNFAGYVALLLGHPFRTYKAFIQVFSMHASSRKLHRPDFEKTRLLQRFLQAFTMARPAEAIALKKCHREDWKRSLHRGMW